MADPSLPNHQCIKCGIFKPLSDFRTYKEVVDVGERRQRRRTECRECAALRCKERRERIRNEELEIANKRLATLLPEKRCNVCTDTKPIEEFSRVNYITSTGKQSWRFNSTCIACRRERDRERHHNNLEKERARQREYQKRTRPERTAASRRYRERNPERQQLWREWKWNRSLERLYGVTFEAYRDFVERHGRQCKICGATEGKIGIDHCHETGKLRGILCSGCNLALGNIKENAERARGLAEYIEVYCKPWKS